MRFVAVCLLLFGVPGGSSNRPVVQVRTFLATTAAHSGSTVKVAVVAGIASGYHINDHKPSLDYLIPTQIIFKETPFLKVEKVIYPRGELTKFAFLDSPISVYEGETRFGVILRIRRLLRPGTYKLPAEFAYQACNDHACLPPAKAPFEITVRVVPPSVPVKSSNTEAFEKINFQ